ncbi:hypothetical protein [Elioraea sp.]|uniref:hypothetical protein n=1 Tax=Elioraea sp. TaxID=2185103 RepID=UPI0025BB693C|nr:hypothetical protein [Elioraea sp.]
MQHDDGARVGEAGWQQAHAVQAEAPVLVRERRPGDHVAPDGWWAFQTVRVAGELLWLRRFGGTRLAEATGDALLGPWHPPR